MVRLFTVLLKSTKPAPRAPYGAGFIDTLRLTVKGGHGGNGLPKYGGIGGQGGCVCFVAKPHVSLKGITQRYREKRIAASNGEDSSKIRIIGRRGVDSVLEVPVGIQILDEKGKLLGDLNEENATCITAGGGIGGCTGTNFIGKPGEQRTVSLDLKLIADVGLVGFPNAGKSTLLKAISNARPKIASYPFTTIRPQLGSIEYPDLRAITIADLPGLIEGAHANYGMGHNFLKHVERTRLLLFMVDIFGFQLSPKHEPRNCLENVYSLNKELELYDDSLLDKPCVLLVNKMDLPGADKILKDVKATLLNLEAGLENCPESLRPERLIKFEKVHFISAKKASRINKLKWSLRHILDDLAAREVVPDASEVRELLEMKISERGPKVT